MYDCTVVREEYIEELYHYNKGCYVMMMLMITMMMITMMRKKKSLQEEHERKSGSKVSETVEKYENEDANEKFSPPAVTIVEIVKQPVSMMCKYTVRYTLCSNKMKIKVEML